MSRLSRLLLCSALLGLTPACAKRSYSDAPPAMPDLPPIGGMSEEPVRLSAPDLTLSEDDLSFSTEGLDLPPPAPAPKAAATAQAPAADSGMIEFDLGSLSLDLGTPAPATTPSASPLPSLADAPETSGAPLSTGFDDSGSDPLATKLALAEEFYAIGDPDGALLLGQSFLRNFDSWSVDNGKGILVLTPR